MTKTNRRRKGWVKSTAPPNSRTKPGILTRTQGSPVRCHICTKTKMVPDYSDRIWHNSWKLEIGLLIIGEMGVFPAAHKMTKFDPVKFAII